MTTQKIADSNTIARSLETPLGTLQLVADQDGLTAIAFPESHDESLTVGTSAILDAAEQQLAEYFAGKRTRFELPLNPAGTDFQKQVWAALCEIPWGETRSYAEQASAIGKAKAVRAVGAANGRNPIPIIVPCHRVIGSDGSLTGFAGGLAMKRQLLQLEGSLLL